MVREHFVEASTQQHGAHEVAANATLHGPLSDGVMVTQQILVLSFKVRALVGQP